VGRIVSENAEYTKFRLEHGFHNPKQPIYSADNIDYVDLLPVLGIAMNMILNEHKDLDNPNTTLEVITQMLVDELPKYLTRLMEILALLKVNGKVT
jgi:hypothetical protein